MRTWFLAVLATLATSSTMRADEPPTLPPLPRLATPGALFLIDTERGVARCERWDVVPAGAGQGALVRSVAVGREVATESIEYLSAGDELTVTGRRRDLAGVSTTMGCELRMPASSLADAIAFGDSRWFVDRAGCSAALQQRARVATDLTGCDLGEAIPAAVAQATRRRFERLLRRGGMAHVADEGRCESFQVTPARRQRPGLVAGRFWRRVVDDGRRGKASVGYLFVPGRNELTLMGSGVTYDDGSGYGMGCADRYRLQYERSSVYASRPIYLSRAACRSAVAATALHDAWIPVVPDMPDDDEAVVDEADIDEADVDEPRESARSSSLALGSC